jgi:polyhydroxyalkanoate synthesis repressor PhaR
VATIRVPRRTLFAALHCGESIRLALHCGKTVAGWTKTPYRVSGLIPDGTGVPFHSAKHNMTSDKQPTVIKKYANRRLYNTGTSTYVTLDDLAEMVKAEDDFVVIDAKSGDDITRSVLTQIIFEQESRGPNLLPINFLRQLIRFYGDSMQNLVPSYLDFSMSSLTREQEKFREQISKTIGATAIGAMEDQVRRNMQMFERAFRMFSPFAAESGEADTDKPAAEQKTAAGDPEIESLKKQLSDVQDRLDKISRKR